MGKPDGPDTLDTGSGRDKRALALLRTAPFEEWGRKITWQLASRSRVGRSGDGYAVALNVRTVDDDESAVMMSHRQIITNDNKSSALEVKLIPVDSRPKIITNDNKSSALEVTLNTNKLKTKVCLSYPILNFPKSSVTNNNYNNDNKSALKVKLNTSRLKTKDNNYNNDNKSALKVKLNTSRLKTKGCLSYPILNFPNSSGKFLKPRGDRTNRQESRVTVPPQLRTDRKPLR
ncbi:hypothetical protein K0M31_014453 [Melipona bicolor]|uniref:Uncharacterized protein n=1 Tax=Melipona bicolor TaxID=60889 RepID=A0AA40KUC7_9HYME|nr:hypothetical protein K0M31_014453 [Melipona bicolor]